MAKYINKYRVESTRLRKWDYSWAASYFITICTNKRKHYLGQIDSGRVHLSRIGIIAKKCWEEIPMHSSFVELSEFVIMPNHVHGIITITKNQIIIPNKNVFIVDNVETRHTLSLQINSQPKLNQIKKIYGEHRFQNQGKNTISSIIGGYKSAVTRISHKMNLEFEWQNLFWDHIIRDEDQMDRIKRYILDNPANWNMDEFL